ncbi:hypothetical protein CONCODRAFT_3890 [Conidiobolus coronatus NRRL 28638]|uniref:Uncharacterized protein n=1 Tax=Conidiobolus coronatus (strain ATCC 28846 / CBS 209.66 / NRRL 28638) TaxID=796925 RepID=A0A137PDZ0_CONC2|nr:hypothetical protein CONCODRAFT_3890 [Conidiobolus coronatus NRRL 28638]|eukprot:KXN73219.1 hypothetical protein CONCODRAFT_3890 [Conidiobolus coronatus NRRL 28638]
MSALEQHCILDSSLELIKLLEGLVAEQAKLKMGDVGDFSNFVTAAVTLSRDNNKFTDSVTFQQAKELIKTLPLSYRENNYSQLIQHVSKEFEKQK